MGKMSWVVGLLFATAGFAADPPYPTENVKGFFVRTFDQFDAAEYVPGTLDTCTEYTSPSYASWSCKLKDAELTLDNGSKKYTFQFVNLNVTEQAGSPSYPGYVSYYMVGKFTLALPDGSKLDSDVTVNFTRKSTDPARMEGRLSAYNVNLNGAIIMRWPGSPDPDPVTPDPAPAPMPTPGPAFVPRPSPVYGP